MSNSSVQKYAHLARPYAEAAFEYARENQKLVEWQSFLIAAANIARNPEASKLISNPETSSQMLLSLFQDVLRPLLDEARKNFLHLLAQYHRFVALPEIENLYNAEYEAFEKMSNVRVITAIEVNDHFKSQLKQILAKRTNHDVTLYCDVDPSILGGAIIHIGDRVIDGSVRGKLNRLLEFSLR